MAGAAYVAALQNQIALELGDAGHQVAVRARGVGPWLAKRPESGASLLIRSMIRKSLVTPSTSPASSCSSRRSNRGRLAATPDTLLGPIDRRLGSCFRSGCELHGTVDHIRHFRATLKGDLPVL